MPSTEVIAQWASILGLGASLASWMDARFLSRLRKKESVAEVTVNDYLEWLRREDQKQLYDELKRSEEAVNGVDRVIRQLKTESEGGIRAISRDLRNGHIAILSRLASLEVGLKCVEEAIHLFVKPTSLGESDRDFELAYLKQVHKRIGRIRLFGVPEMRDIKQDLSVAYVSLRLAASARADYVQSAAGMLLDNASMTIRGAAGSGKTTLLDWVAVQCADRSTDNPWRFGVPFFIPLRSVGISGRSDLPLISDFVRYSIDPKIWDHRPPNGWIARP